MDKICSFFGHRKVENTKELENELLKETERLISEGISTFYFGGFGEFDNLCWQTVTKLKEKYPTIKRVFCLFDSRHINEIKRPKWLKNDDYEEFVYLDLDFDYWYKRIYFRNCEMIKRSDIIIFYVNKTENSGAYKALRFAKACKKKYINLAPSKL